MNTEEEIQYWVNIAEQDIPVAQSLFDNGHYVYCLYIGHLILEKILKAHYVKDNKKTPPKTHNLVYLAERTNVNITEEEKAYLFDVNTFNIETRYPDYKNEFYKKCTRGFTENNFSKIKDYYKWLLSILK